MTSRTAQINSDGTYQIKTLIGANRVSLTGPEVRKKVPTAEFQKFDYDVKPGDNTFDIDLSKK